LAMEEFGVSLSSMKTVPPAWPSRLGLNGQREPANQENEPCRMLE